MELLFPSLLPVISLVLKVIMFVSVVFFKRSAILKCCYPNSSFYFDHVFLTQEKILMDVFLFLSHMKDQVNYYSLHGNCGLKELFLIADFSVLEHKREGKDSMDILFSPTSLAIQGSTYLRWKSESVCYVWSGRLVVE